MGGESVVLPADVQGLQQLVVRLQNEVSFLSSKATVLEEELRLLLHKIFGRRSERFSQEESKQSALFDEAEGTSEAPGQAVSRLTLIRQVFARFSGLHVPLTLSTDSV